MKSGGKFKKHLMSLLAQLSALHSNHREGAVPGKAPAEEMSADLQEHSCARDSKEGEVSAKGAGDSQHWELCWGHNAQQADTAGGQQCHRTALCPWLSYSGSLGQAEAKAASGRALGTAGRGWLWATRGASLCSLHTASKSTEPAAELGGGVKIEALVPSTGWM